MSLPRALAVAAACLGIAIAIPAVAEVRVYDVEPQYRQEIFNALDQLFAPDGRVPNELYVHVAMLPTGQIAVDALPERQAEIAAALEAIARSAPSATPSVALRYWVLFGTPGPQDGAEPPPLLEPVVRELQTALGNLSFSIIDTASLVSRSGELAVSQSRTLELSQTVYVNGSSANADIGIQTGFQELEVKVTLEEGEFLVLGDSRVALEQAPGTAVFVVHWPARD